MISKIHNHVIDAISNPIMEIKLYVYLFDDRL
jgi:hypothetical protein